MKSAFQYIVSLKHEDQPNYELIKLWMAFDEDDEKNVFDTNLKVGDQKLADDMLYDNQKAEEIKIDRTIVADKDLDVNYEFD